MSSQYECSWCLKEWKACRCDYKATATVRQLEERPGYKLVDSRFEPETLPIDLLEPMDA